MAKNPRRQEKGKSMKVGDKTSSSVPFVSRWGKKWIGAGIALVICGFWVLTFTDPRGQNWASKISPLLLVLGYAIIGIGLVVPASQMSAPEQNSPPT